jgi:hypothetical protein
MFGKTNMQTKMATFNQRSLNVSPAWNGIYELRNYRRSQSLAGRLAALLGKVA